MQLFQIFKTFTKTERRLFLGTLMVFLAASFFWGASYFYSHTVAIPVASAQYTEGVIGQPTFLNPAISGANDADRDLSEIIFSGLLDLTDNYKSSQDQRVWTVALKPELKWDDGQPLTSDDVIFTIETIQNAEARSPLFATWQGVVAERISELEVQFTLRTPYAFFLDNLKELKIIPAHIFSQIPAANIRLSDFNLEPVGSGPYKFASYQKRKDGFITEYQLTANKNYSGSSPLIKNLTIKFFANTDDLIRAFNSKKVDGFGDLDPKNLNDVKLSHETLEINLPRYYAIFFNPNSHEALKESSVREALNLATDKKKIIQQVFDNKALIVNQPLLPIIPGLQAKTNEFDLDKASQLLESAQWIKNSEGIREKKIGKNTIKLEFDLVVPQIPFLQETVNIIKEDWLAIGVRLNPLVLNPMDVANEVIKTRNYQMLIFGNILKLNPDIFSFWHSSERFYPGLNLALYENKKADTLLENIRKDFDETKRNEEINQLQELINADQPAIFLFSPVYLYVGPRTLGGFDQKILATPSDRFENISQWYLKTARVFK